MSLRLPAWNGAAEATPEAGVRGRTPDLQAMAAWLSGSEVIDPDGAVASWYNPAHPGYPYPEAAGLWLGASPWIRTHLGPGAAALFPATARRVATRLLADVSSSGGVGRRGTDYLFDAAVCIAGLCRYARAFAGSPAGTPAGLDDGLRRLHAFTCAQLRRQQATRPAPPTPSRWSLRMGPHQRKVALGLWLYARHTGLPVPQEAREGLAALGGYPEGQPLYLHAHCYALEAERFEAGRRAAAPGPAHRAALRRLAELQDPCGGLPAFLREGAPQGPLRADATAQAARLWILADPVAFAPAIAGALRFLAELQHPSGAIRYELHGEDRNTWATLFAAQATHWHLRGGATPAHLL